MREDPDNHGGLFDGGDNRQVAATMRAMFDIDRENAFEQARPTHARRCVVCVLGGAFTSSATASGADASRALRLAPEVIEREARGVGRFTVILSVIL